MVLGSVRTAATVTLGWMLVDAKVAIVVGPVRLEDTVLWNLMVVVRLVDMMI